MSMQTIAALWAVLAATLYALNAPFSKLLLHTIPPTMMAAFLYLGAGAGIFAVKLVQHIRKSHDTEQALPRKDIPYVIGMVVLDIAAPVFLMAGLTMTTAANASLLNNFEIVATSIIAFSIFKEAISRRLWCAIALVTAASILLSIENASSFSFSPGSILVLLACICWGMENNCTRRISDKDPLQIVIIKGFCSGAGALMIALLLKEPFPGAGYLAAASLLGFVAYGLSIFFYIRAQRYLGSAKTSAYYALAPFIGVAFSFAVLKEAPTPTFFAALLIMVGGTFLAFTDNAGQKE